MIAGSIREFVFQIFAKPEIQKMEDREYGNMADVMKSFGKGSEEGSSGKSSSKGTGQTGQGRSSHKSSHH